LEKEDGRNGVGHICEGIPEKGKIGINESIKPHHLQKSQKIGKPLLSETLLRKFPPTSPIVTVKVKRASNRRLLTKTPSNAETTQDFT